VVRFEAEVETSILTTKLNIPLTRPQLVTRPRLMERLQEGLNYSLILVSAPAGFGKTTLLSEWVRHNQQQIPTAWVSLDEGDNDPVRFWDYFIASIQTFQTNFAENIMPWLKSSEPPSTEPLIIALINELANIAGDCVIVLDDYHLIESGEIHDGITYLLEHIPAQMHLVVAARADPHLPLAKFRGRGTMLEIGADDLRFTVEDATCLLKELKTPELSADAVAALNDRTEGWAVGLKMAALSISGQKDIHGFISSFTGSQRYVMDYLIEEVLQKQSDETRDFLLKTSVLERLSAPLCDAVTGLQGSRDILLSLERVHLFIIPLDESRQWYRYEHLFADLLRHQLENICGTEDIKRLHHRASQWYENNNLPDEAIHHALATRDWDKNLPLIKEEVENKIKNGYFVTSLNWLRKIPEDVIHRDLHLCFRYGLILWQTGQYDAAASVADYMEQEVENDDVIVQGYIASLRFNIAMRRGDIERSLELGEKALSLYQSNESFHRSGTASIMGGIYLYKGIFQEARRLLTEGYDAARKSGNNQIAVFAISLLAVMSSLQGNIRVAAEQHQQNIELYEPSTATFRSHFHLSQILYELNDLEAAVGHIHRSIELGLLIGSPGLYGENMYDILAYIRLAQGDEAGLLEALEEADSEVCKIGVSLQDLANHAAYRIILALFQDDLAAAEKWSARLEEYAHALSYEYRHIPLRLLIARGQKSEALEKLQVLYDEAVKSGMHGLMIEYRVYQALAAETQEEALEYLSEALTSAEPEGYIRTFVDEGKLLKSLLEKALSQGITPEYTRKLITIIEAEERLKLKRKRGEGASSPYQALLSERELEILRLIAVDVSNQQIADSLTISLSTVKTHVHHILEKLNAKDRSQAVFYARELELM
jgi:LuxR family maltose regulon positive regulatory protein